MSDLSADAIREFRTSAGLTVVDAARELSRLAPSGTLPGIDSLVRSWKRWEAGTAPSRIYRPLLRSLVGAGHAPTGDAACLDLAGDWWAAWQHSQRRGSFDLQPARVEQHGVDLRIEAVDRGLPLDDGGFLWSGEMRLWDNEILMGWYAATEGAARGKGTLYFALDPVGLHMPGRWVGMSRMGRVVDGWSVLARTRDLCETTMKDLIEGEAHGRRTV